jgi:hypothetical protein
MPDIRFLAAPPPPGFISPKERSYKAPLGRIDPHSGSDPKVLPKQATDGHVAGSIKFMRTRCILNLDIVYGIVVLPNTFSIHGLNLLQSKEK